MSTPTVLLTNDDGGYATGLNVARRALARVGVNVIVVAPDSNRSATGHAVTCRGNLTVTRLPDDEIGPVFLCSGSPVDCVRVGVLSDLTPSIDMVVSGINHGVNMGDDVHYSGTVAAAVEAALLGVPAIAASQHGTEDGLPFLATNPGRFPFGDYLAETVMWSRTVNWPERTLLNINFPHVLTSADVEFARLGTRPWLKVNAPVRETNGAIYTIDPWANEPGHNRTPGTDFTTVDAGSIAVNVLSVAGGFMDAGSDAPWLATFNTRAEVSTDDGSDFPNTEINLHA